MFIYVITNKINGYRYVGKTQKSSILDRWQTHIRDRVRYYTKFYNAFNKYGPDQFEITELESTGSISRAQLNEREIYWIATLCPEYNTTKGGDGGWINDQTGKHWKIADTSRMKGTKTVTDKVIQGRLQITGENNYQANHTIHTPWGTFQTWRDAVKEAKKLRIEQQRKDVVTDGETLKLYCKQNIQLSRSGRRTFPQWRGHFTKDLGFYIEAKP